MHTRVSTSVSCHSSSLHSHTLAVFVIKFPDSKEGRCYCFFPFGCHERNETCGSHFDSTSLQFHRIYEARHVVEWNYRVIYGRHYPEACRLNLPHRSHSRISVYGSELRLVLPRLTFKLACSLLFSHVLLTYVWAFWCFLSCVISATIIFILEHLVCAEPSVANRWQGSSLCRSRRSCPWFPR